MKFTPRQWQAVILAGLMGWVSVAMASEPMAGDKIRASSTPKLSDEEPHGLLAGGLFGAYWRTASDGPSQSEPSDQEGAELQQAAWNNNATENTEIASVAPPPLSEACSANLSGDCDCCTPMWCHRCGVFADLLYIRPGNIDYIYAQERTGTLPTDSPTGPVGRVGFDAALGYRFGVNHAMSDCSSLQFSYTWFQVDTQDSITAAPGTVLAFLPGDPSIPNVGASSIQASARYNLRFQQADLDYRGLLYGTDNSALNYFGGIRYANLKQDFHAQEDVGAPTGLTDAISHISFDGFGIGMGLDGIRRSAYSGLLVYGRGSASFVSGEFKANFRQLSQFGPNSVVGNDLVDYRVMSILQTELGVGWQNCFGCIRVTAGYQFAGWFNALTIPSYIAGVQTRQFSDLNETLSFDGLVARVLWQF